MMARSCECPKCGIEMQHQSYDPDVGIMSGYWFCTTCEPSVTVLDEDEPDYDE
jgi:hypothetical protein